MSKRPNLSSLKKATPDPAPQVPAIVEESEPPARKRSTVYKERHRPTTLYYHVDQMARLKAIAFRERKSLRRLMFEAINVYLPTKDELPVPDEEGRD